VREREHRARVLIEGGEGKGVAWQKRVCILLLIFLLFEMLTSSVSFSTAYQDKASPRLKRGMEMDGTVGSTMPTDLSGSAWRVLRPHHRSALSTGKCLMD
jgi:hypothetical protein